MTKKAEQDGLTRSEMAKKLGVKVRQLDNLVAEGMPRTDTPSGYRYDEAKSVAWHAQFKTGLRDGAPINKVRRGAEDRIALARARMVELELAEREGRKVDLAEVEELLRSTFERFRAKLNPVPAKLAAKLIGVKSYGAALTAIRPIWDEMLTELAKTGHELSGHTNGNRQTTAQPRRRRDVQPT